MCRLIFIVNSSQYKFKVIISETSFISRNLLIFPSAYLLDFSFLRPISGALYLLESVIPSILGVFTVVGSFFHGRVGGWWGTGAGVMSRRSKYWPPWLTNGRNLKKILAKTS